MKRMFDIGLAIVLTVILFVVLIGIGAVRLGTRMARIQKGLFR